MFFLSIFISCRFRRKETVFWIKTNTLPSILLKAFWPTAARNEKPRFNLRHHWVNPWSKPRWVLEPKKSSLGAFGMAEDRSSLAGMVWKVTVRAVWEVTAELNKLWILYWDLCFPIRKVLDEWSWTNEPWVDILVHLSPSCSLHLAVQQIF